MPHLFSDLPDKLRLALSQAANVFLVVVMIYIFQYIFNSQFSCSCEEEFHKIVVIYLGLIPVILFVILNLLKLTRTKVCGACCCGLCPQLFQLLGITLFWVGCVLLDGDLYVCLATKHNATLREIPCKTDQRTLHETIMITKYKNCSQDCACSNSVCPTLSCSHTAVRFPCNLTKEPTHTLWDMFIGYIFIAAGFTGWWLISSTKIALLCNTCESFFLSLCFKRCEKKPYYKRRYEELLSEEMDKHLDEKLQDIAKERVKGICSKYNDSIRSSQLSKQTDETTVNVDECWSAISQTDFYKSLLSQDLHSLKDAGSQTNDSIVVPDS